MFLIQNGATVPPKPDPPVIFEVDLVTLDMTTPNLTRPLACKCENFAIFVGYCLKKIDANF
jgi:hypothetical protein